MKTTLCLLTCVVLHASLHAATWRVDNNTSHPADFRTIQAAIDAAAVGDTILVAGSNDAYNEGITLTKRLNIKGERASAVGLGTSVAGQIELTEVFNDVDPNHLRNASGSVIESITGGQITVEGPCSGVTIKRCEMGFISLSGCSGALVKNCSVSSVYVSDHYAQGSRRFIGTGSSIIGSWADSLDFTSSTNALVEHCVIGTYVASESQTSGPISTNDATAPFVIRNSILIAKTTVFSDAESYNTANNAKATFDHCLLISDSTLPAGNGNINRAYINFPSVFVDATPYSTDPEGIVLKAGSPAIGAGIGGVDLGMYGGASPFVKDFIPALPRVNYMAVPPVVPHATGLSFEVRAEARE